MNEQNIGNVKTVVVNRDKLLDIIKENKAKHDALFDAALSGYWIAAHTRIEKKREEFNTHAQDTASYFYKITDVLLDKVSKKEKVNDCSYINVPNPNFNYCIDLKYPESHAYEYEKAIRSISLNVYDKIELNEQEFNQYVMNDWSWKNSFISSNSNYIYSGMSCITGYYANAIQTSGCLIL